MSFVTGKLNYLHYESLWIAILNLISHFQRIKLFVTDKIYSCNWNGSRSEMPRCRYFEKDWRYIWRWSKYLSISHHLSGNPFLETAKKNDHEIFIKVFLIKIPLSFFFAGIWILSIYNFRIAVIQENHLALMCQNAWAQRTKDLRMYQQSQMWAMQRFKMYEIPQIDENAGP